MGPAAPRPLIDRQVPALPLGAAWTELGAGVVGSHFIGESGKIGYTFYVLNGTTLDFTLEEKVQTRDPKRDKLGLEAEIAPTPGSFDGNNTADAVTGRFAVSPSLRSEYALSGYWGKYTPEWLGASEDITAAGFDFLRKVGRFRIEGEALYTRFGGIRSVLTAFATAARDRKSFTTTEETAQLEAEIEFDVKDLAKERFGFWVDIKIPLSLRGRPLGLGLEDPTLVPIVRYERAWNRNRVTAFEFEDRAITALEWGDVQQERISVGLSYRPVPLVAMQLAYERNDLKEGPSLLFPEVPDESTDGVLFGMAFGF